MSARGGAPRLAWCVFAAAVACGVPPAAPTLASALQAVEYAPVADPYEPWPVAGLTQRERTRILRMSPLPGLPPDPTNAFADDPAAARLGQALFFDARLSNDGSVACVTCHDPTRGWSDGRRLARGLHDVDFHTPTLLNVAHQRWFFWDGRADALWTQALAPLENPKEHGADRVLVARVLHGDERLARAYADVFGPLPALDDEARFPPRARPVPEDPRHEHQRAWDAMDAADQDAVNRVFANTGKALAAYQRRLLSGEAPIDRFVDGLRTGDLEKLAALEDAAVRGARLFVGRANCHLCHGGPTFSDLEFHDVFLPPMGGRPAAHPGRLGAFRALRNAPFSGAGEFSDDRATGEDKIFRLLPAEELYGAFKTPSLRNVALTAPYMHGGHFATLDEVLDHYSVLPRANERAGHRHAAARKTESILQPLFLTARERADLRAFLEALTGAEVDPALTRPPAGLEPPPPRPRARTLQDFEALSSRNLEAHPLEDLAGLDRVRAWRLRRDVERSLAEPGATRFKEPLFLAGVEALDAREAAELASFAGGRLFLRDLRGLERDAAEALVRFRPGGGGELFLDGLQTLDAEVAALLAAWRGERLSFAALPELSPEVAAILASFGGGLELGGLARVDVETARALARWRAPEAGRLLALDGVAVLDPEAAAALAACRGWGLSLGGLTRLDAETAAALASAEVTLLRLDGVVALDPAAVDVMVRWRARVVELRGLAAPEEAVRARLEAASAAFTFGASPLP